MSQYQISLIRGLCEQQKTNKGIDLSVPLMPLSAQSSAAANEPFLYKPAQITDYVIAFYHLYRCTTTGEPTEVDFGWRIPAILL